MEFVVFPREKQLWFRKRPVPRLAGDSKNEKFKYRFKIFLYFSPGLGGKELFSRSVSVTDYDEFASSLPAPVSSELNGTVLFTVSSQTKHNRII